MPPADALSVRLPFGSWPSPITADVLVRGVVSLANVRVADGAVWWTEARPQESGRTVVVRCNPTGPPIHADAVPAPVSARSRVHEYGGAAFAVHGGYLYYSDQADQRVWRSRPAAAAAVPTPLTPEPLDRASVRYADHQVSPDGRWLACVRERHDGPRATDVHNDLVLFSTDPGGAGPAVLVLAEGHDFFAAPRWSPDGRRLAWLSWDHPDLPWDSTTLWAGEVEAAPGPPGLVNLRRLAGGPDESVSQPRWSPDGNLHWVSDRTGWWNLYAEGRDGGPAQALAPMDAEFARPDWVFGQSSYTFLPGGRLVTTWTAGGGSRLGVVEAGRVTEIVTPFNDLSSLQPLGDEVVAIAGSARRLPAVVAIDVATGASRVLRPSAAAGPPEGAVSEARLVAFPTRGGRSAHAYLYPPRLDGFTGLAGEKPPLIVVSHGGPTGATSPVLNLGVQFWTSRGFAVVDVDYGGSTGYGREYRRRLDGQWGVVDVEDCVNAARHLVAMGAVDPARIVARGSSAGGFTTLCALTFHDLFAAGASYYGIGDLEALAKGTHKFEARYLDRLVGPYPAQAATYRARSPVRSAHLLTTPVILFQGLDDRVVLPGQSEAMAAALRANGVRFEHVTFEGEQHGFRREATIKRAVEAELSFYGQVLGFTPAGGPTGPA